MSTLTMPLAPLKLPKRLTRPTRPQAFICMDRDLDIMALPGRFRFVTSDQVIRHLERLTAHELAVQLKDKPWKYQVYLRRLHLLWANNFLIRPDRQRSDVIDFGNAPLIYGLSRKGALQLKKSNKAVHADLDWTAQQRASRQWLMHTVQTCDAVLHFDLSCRRLGSHTLIDHDALLPLMPVSTRAMPKPFVLRADLANDRVDESTAVIPDRLIGLQCLPRSNDSEENPQAEPDSETESERKNTFRLLALEIDRGTVSLKKFTRRLVRYHAAWKADLHITQWGCKSIRVCTITPSLLRLEHMIAAQQEALGGGSNLFCFSTPELLAERGALGASWITGKGDTVSLLGD